MRRAILLLIALIGSVGSVAARQQLLRGKFAAESCSATSTCPSGSYCQTNSCTCHGLDDTKCGSSSPPATPTPSPASPPATPTPSPATPPPAKPSKPQSIHDVGNTAWVYGNKFDPTLPESPCQDPCVKHPTKSKGYNTMGMRTIDNLKAAEVSTPILYGVDVFDDSLNECASTPGSNNPAITMAPQFKAQGFKKVFASVSAGVNSGDACPLVDFKAVAQKVHDCFSCGADVAAGGIDGIVFDFEHDCKITTKSSRDLVVEMAKLCPNLLYTFQDFNPDGLTSYYDDLKDVSQFFGMVIMYDYGPGDYNSITKQRLEQIMGANQSAQLPFTLSLPINKGVDMSEGWIKEFKAQNVASSKNFIGANYYAFDPNEDHDSTKASALAQVIKKLPEHNT